MVCAQVLLTPSSATEYKLPSNESSLEQLKGLVLNHEVHGKGIFITFL